MSFKKIIAVLNEDNDYKCKNCKQIDNIIIFCEECEWLVMSTNKQFLREKIKEIIKEIVKEELKEETKEKPKDSRKEKVNCKICNKKLAKGSLSLHIKRHELNIKKEDNNDKKLNFFDSIKEWNENKKRDCNHMYCGLTCNKF